MSRTSRVVPLGLPEEPSRRLFGRAATIFERAIVGYEQSRTIANLRIEWVWEGIIAQRHAAEIAGPSYSGKSRLAILLAVARANPMGEPVVVLGRKMHPAPAGKKVAICNEENSQQSAVAAIDAAIEMLGLDPEATWDRLVLFSRTGTWAHHVEGDERRTPTDVWGALLVAARERDLDLLVLDTRARILRVGSSKEEEAQAEAAELIVEYIEAAGAPVLVVSHTRKGGGNEIEDISGSAQRGGGADVILMLQPERSEGRVLSSKIVFAKLRDGIDEHPEPVTFSIARSAEGVWRLAMNASAREDDQPLHDRIHALLRTKGELPKNEVRKAMKCNGTRLTEAFGVLKAERRIKWRKDQAGTWFASAIVSDVELPFVRSAHATRKEGFSNDPYDV